MKKSKIIIIFLAVAIILFLIGLLFLYKDQKVAVLGYHTFIKSEERNETNQRDNMVMDIEKFEEQLKYLQEHHYKTLSLDEFYCYHEGICKIPRKSVLITMDDGYQSNYDLALPLLKRYNMKATIFYLGINNAGENPNYMDLATIENIKQKYKNIDLASHSYNLHTKGAIDKDYEELLEDITKEQEMVDSKYYAYPFGEYNECMIKALKEKGYKMAFTFGPGREHRKATKADDAYKIPRLNISNDMPMWKFILRLKMFY